ncbi:MAG: 50S ribosomal protein L19e, partial [Candidatus Micrarchaeota archaeon]
ALTRADVRGLIDKGVITRLKPQGRASTRRTKRRGRGKRKGHPVDTKTLWMEKIRAQRKFLQMLLSTGALSKESKRAIYQKVKSGIFRNKKAMLLYLKDNKLVAADYEVPKGTPKEKPAKAAPKAKAEKMPVAKPAKKEGESK